MRKPYVLTLCLLTILTPAGILSAAPPSGGGDKVAIEALEQEYVKAFNAKDVNGIMAHYAPGAELFVFDVVPPRQYVGWDAYKKDWEGVFAAYPGPVGDAISDLNITVVGPVAYAHHIETGYFTDKNGKRTDVVVRVTDVFRKINGKWLIVQEHISFPVDIESGKADLLSKP